MTEFEKIEKLREHANVTFEEAKEALNASDGDLLDAMIWLERRGKVNGPAQSVHSTKYEDQKSYESVSEKVKKTQSDEESTGKKVKRGIRRVWDFLTGNYFVISKDGREIIVMPLLILLILVLFVFVFTVIALIVLLFFGFHYSFRGRDNLNSANEVMTKAADAASGFTEKVREDLKS